MINIKLLHEFISDWTGKGYEKGQSQSFWRDLLTAFGVEKPSQFIDYELPVQTGHTCFMDGYIRSTSVLVEQKSIDINLGKGYKQSDGVFRTAFEQARNYAAFLPHNMNPRWIITCNFKEFWVYDMNYPNMEPQKILLENLEKEWYRLEFLVKEGNENLQKEMELSIKAGDLVGRIYDLILPQYANPNDPETLKSLNQLCVRLVFCLFAEDAGLFGDKNEFHDYLERFPARDIRRALIDLFKVLDTKPEDRDPYLDDELKNFPYVNGGLFSNENIEIPQFTEELKNLILTKASADFDWSEISPTIFGAVFESTLNPETRRSGGMHYTSIENIHKVIDPLFLNQLGHELDACGDNKKSLQAFQDKLASLTFFDPACGSGNFLTETYISLRRLENKAVQKIFKEQPLMGELYNPIKVSIHQFYGIEINDFAVSVATTALWIAELQMLRETERIATFEVDPLPLKTYHNIHEGNALRLDWSEVIAPENLNYIMGNPPFVGARWMNKEQKADVIDIFGSKWEGVGDLDYVCCWYKKATDMLQNTTIRCALVSTNSITQGGAVANLWKPLMNKYGIHIDFAYPTFRWDSESSLKAHVHCVIVGFSKAEKSTPVRLYNTDGTYQQCENINGYLVNASNVYIEKRTKPIHNVPSINLGGQAIDDGNLVLTEEEKDALLKAEPQAEKYIRHYMMGKDFIERRPRYCLWMKGANPTDLRHCPLIMERVKKVREFRLASDRTSTLKAAENPTLFAAPFESEGDYVAIPKVSSEQRRYIPIDYLSKEIIPGDKLFVMQNASLFHFGILTSNVHMAWMRAVCGRLKSDYSYSNTIVYNNFPWPTPTDEQKAKIEQTAQAILDARAKYPNCSLADLYDDNVMPADLRKAHQENDKAVMAAYGFKVGMTESECVARLLEMYQELTR